MARRRRQTWTQGVELIVQPLLSDRAVGHQASSMPDRRTQRFHRGLLAVASTEALASQIRQAPRNRDRRT